MPYAGLGALECSGRSLSGNIGDCGIGGTGRRKWASCKVDSQIIWREEGKPSFMDVNEKLVKCRELDVDLIPASKTRLHAKSSSPSQDSYPRTIDVSTWGNIYQQV